MPRRLLRPFRRLVVHVPEPVGPIISANQQSGSAVFLTAQSLVSFPIAVGVIKLAVALLEKQWSIMPKNSTGPASLAIGFLLFIIGIQEPQDRPKGLFKWFVAVMIAVINTMFLAAAAFGIDVKQILNLQ
jgi:hypothetical protein